RAPLRRHQRVMRVLRGGDADFVVLEDDPVPIELVGHEWTLVAPLFRKLEILERPKPDGDEVKRRIHWSGAGRYGASGSGLKKPQAGTPVLRRGAFPDVKALCETVGKGRFTIFETTSGV